MRTFYPLALTAPILLALFGRSATAQDGAVYLVTYVELMPNALASGSSLLKRYRDSSRTEVGNLRFDVLAEIARDNRFVIVEGWRDKAALDAHAHSAPSAQFNEKVNVIEDAPADVRVTRALYRAQGANENRAGAVYAVTHIDVIPPGLDTCTAALKTMSVDTAKDSGNIGYEVLEQFDHPNHFTVVEEWTDRKTAEAHAMAMHTRAFRDKLKPITGALYDERFYKALN